MRRFTDATLLMQCIDDLETLYSHNVLLWFGLKASAMYNQDWLFCWCLQVRMGGTVYLDTAFEDVVFPGQLCVTISQVAQYYIGTHHTSPRKLRVLWKAYTRVAMRKGWLLLAPHLAGPIINASFGNISRAGGGGGGRREARSSSPGPGSSRSLSSLSSPSSSSSPSSRSPAAASATIRQQDPSRPRVCEISPRGDPYESFPSVAVKVDDCTRTRTRTRTSTGTRTGTGTGAGPGTERNLSLLARDRGRSNCGSVLDAPDAPSDQRERYPQCAAHMHWVTAHPTTSPCYGALGRSRCGGFELDASDACNVQYYLFCEVVFKPGSKASAVSWCPSPDGYPRHCCYAHALEESTAHGPARHGPQYLLNVFPKVPSQKPFPGV